MDLGASQPICTGTSEQPTSQVHPQELVGPDTPGVPLSKRRQDLENDPSISRSHIDSARDYTDSRDMTDSIKRFPTRTEIDDVTTSSVTISEDSNSLEIEANVYVCKKSRIQDDGPHDEGIPIMYKSNCRYLKLNDDADNYFLETDDYLPASADNPNMRKKYLFKWTPTKEVPQAGLLSVLTYYVALDTSTKGFKVLPGPPSDNGAGLVHRLCRGDSPAQKLWLLYFVYEGKYYQIKAENGVPAVEEQKSENDLNHDYVWNASL